MRLAEKKKNTKIKNTLSTRGCTFSYDWAREEFPSHTHHTMDMRANTILVATYICVMHNVRLYVHIVHTMICACQNTSDKYAKTIEKHEKMPKIPWKMRIYTGTPRSKIHFWHPSRAQCVFFMVTFWKFSFNRRRHWAREDFLIFVGPLACEKQKKKTSALTFATKEFHWFTALRHLYFVCCGLNFLFVCVCVLRGP